MQNDELMHREDLKGSALIKFLWNDNNNFQNIYFWHIRASLSEILDECINFELSMFS